ncbi:hypothetical protein WN943_008303 [Citrus x changshan-huyou]
MATGNCRLLVGCGDVPVKDTRGGNGMDEDIRAKEGRMLMLFGQEKRPAGKAGPFPSCSYDETTDTPGDSIRRWILLVDNQYHERFLEKDLIC